MVHSIGNLSNNKPIRIKSYDFLSHNITGISIRKNRLGFPDAFIVSWKDGSISGVDGPFLMYREFRRQLRKVGATDILGRLRDSAMVRK